MTIYTVLSIDDLAIGPIHHCTIGSYTTRGSAIDECVNYIMERIGIRDDFAWSMAHDQNHPEAREFFSERRKGGATVVRRGCSRKLREFLRDEVGGQGCYYVYDGHDSWHFDIDENEVAGEYWHTVTWGDSDCEDPEFTTPWPEAFVDRESAMKEFYDYACSLKKGHGEKISEDFKSFVFDSLIKDGMCQVDLGDGCAVSCVIYHDDLKNVKGAN